VKEGTFLFDQNNFYSAEILYSSDLSTYFDVIPVTGNGLGVWGLFTWGAGLWGGEGSDVPVRTLIPQQKQRCRYITCRFKHINAREKFRIIGISLDPRVVSTRAYR
jgi:hypothetical protein